MRLAVNLKHSLDPFLPPVDAYSKGMKSGRGKRTWLIDVSDYAVAARHVR